MRTAVFMSFVARFLDGLGSTGRAARRCGFFATPCKPVVLRCCCWLSDCLADEPGLRAIAERILIMSGPTNCFRVQCILPADE